MTVHEDGRAEVVEVEGSVLVKGFRELVKVCAHVCARGEWALMR